MTERAEQAHPCEHLTIDIDQVNAYCRAHADNTGFGAAVPARSSSCTLRGTANLFADLADPPPRHAGVYQQGTPFTANCGTVG